MEEQKIKDIIKEIPQYKITKIANEISIRITNVFTNLKAQQDNLFKKLEECQIKIVKFENESITHYYLNGVIYLSNEIYINSINEELIIEYLHFLQKNNNNTIFTETLNVLTAKILMQDLKERMNKFEIFFMSLKEGKFALLVNLIMQINFLVGDNEFIQTVINSKDDYYLLLNEISNGNIDRLIKDFTKLYNLEVEYDTTDDLYKVQEDIKFIYFSIQNYIMKFYFYYRIIHITEAEEVAKLRSQLDGLQTLRGIIEEDKFYEEESKKIIERLDNKEKEFKKKNSKNSISIVYNNKLIAFIKRILSFNH